MQDQEMNTPGLEYTVHVVRMSNFHYNLIKYKLIQPSYFLSIKVFKNRIINLCKDELSNV